MRQLVEPDLTSVKAALVEFKEVLVNKLRDASKLRPITIKISKKERKAWDNYEKEMGKDIPVMFGYQSLSDIAEEAISEFEKSVLKSKKHIVTKNHEKY